MTEKEIDLDELLKHESEWTQLSENTFGYKGMIICHGQNVTPKGKPLVIGEYDESKGFEGMKKSIERTQ